MKVHGYKVLTAVVAVLSLIVAMPCSLFAEEGDLAKLLERVKQLETDNQSMKTSMTKVISENESLKSEVNVLKTKSVQITPTPDQPVKAAQPAEVNNVTVKAPNTISVYGFLKGDVIANSSNMGALAFNGAVKNKNQTEFNARDSRIGLDINGPEFLNKNGKVKGKFEMDFYGLASNTNSNQVDDGNNSPLMRMRQAYVDLIYKNADLLVGQTWDFFAPLNPTTLTFPILWRAGNIGDRHPQARLGYTFNNVFGGKVLTQVGALSSSLYNENSGQPVYAGFASYERKIFGRNVMVGSGALYGQQKMSNSPVMSSRADMWGVTVVTKMELHPKITLQGEGYIGQDLADFRAGSASGVIITNSGNEGKGVRSNGGWLQIITKPFKRWEVTGGMGIDHVSSWVPPSGSTTPSNSGTAGSTASIWDQNYTYIGNVTYEIAKGLYAGLEYQHFVTKYRQQNGGNGNRVMGSIIYKF